MAEAEAPTLKQRVTNEIRSLAEAALYFGAWIGMLILIKTLVLAEYDIEFRDFSVILIGALILSKVVLVLEHVSLGAWVQGKPALVDVVLRTTVYGLGLVVVLVLEGAFEGRHEAGGFGPALKTMFQKADGDHIIVNAICLSGALLGYNVLALVRKQLGPGGLTHLFMSPLREESEPGSPRAT